MSNDKRFSSPRDTELPPAIETAAIDGNLVFFIGNGISRLYGMPSWDGLANEMIDLLAKERTISYAKADLLKARSLKIRVSIADDYIKKHGQLNSNLSYKKVLKGKNDAKAYRDLATCGAKFVTTNYDSLLSLAYQNENLEDSPLMTGQPDASTIADIKTRQRSVKVIQNPHDFTLTDFLHNNIIWHLHGCADTGNQVIASTKDYLKHYSDPKIQENLQHVFSNQVVVFLGYGLEEMELLDIIVRASRAQSQMPLDGRIFLVLPIYSYEFDIYQDLTDYYSSHLGIDVIPMCQDNHGFSAFEELIENWAKKISKIIQEPNRIQRIKLLNNLIAKVEANDTE